MSAVRQPPPPPNRAPAPAGSAGGVVPAGAPLPGGPGAALRASAAAAPAPPSLPRGTPAFLRQWNVVLMVLVAAFAVVGSIASLVMRSASETTANSTAPALIGVQDLFASVAEANTAATAAFLSISATDTEDRVNRNLYQDAIQRATAQTEEVSAIIGPDEEAHEALKTIGISLNSYSGQVEAARMANQNNLPGAETQLREALRVVQEDVEQAVTTVTDRGQSQLDEERTTGRLLTWIAIGLGVLTLLALFRVQVGLLARTNRIFNPLLVIATLLIGTVVAYLIVGPVARSQSLDEASSGGYDAIVTTARIQTDAFNLQSQLSLKLLDDSSVDLETLFAEVEQSITELQDGADSPRENAAAETLAVRWQRYEEVARTIDTQASNGDRAAAVELFQGEGLANFNGLNTGVESALSDNRTQFISGVNTASNAVSTTPFLSIILPVLAALAILLAIQRRLGEYR